MIHCMHVSSHVYLRGANTIYRAAEVCPATADPLSRRLFLKVLIDIQALSLQFTMERKEMLSYRRL